MTQASVGDSHWPSGALGASSLGMPSAPLPDFLTTVVGHDGRWVELRVGDDEPVRADLDEAQARAIGEQCRSAGVDVLALASYVRICAPGDDVAVVDDLTTHLRLAAAMGAGGVRVFPGGTAVGGAGGGAGGGADDDARGARRLAAVAPIARTLGVRVLLETHDSHPRGADVVRVLEAAGVEPTAVGVIWDAAHPWIAGEEPTDTADIVAQWLAHAQLKDTGARRRGSAPVLPGAGVLPLGDVVDALDARRLHVPLVLEWEKAWFDDIPDLDAALAATATWLEQRA